MISSPSATPRRHEFDAPLEMDGADNGVFVIVPFDVPTEYGVKGALPVQGTIDGFPIRLNLTPMGGEHHGFSVRKEVRNAIDKTWADTVHVVLWHDTDPSGLELPAELAQALDRTGLRAKFDALPFTQRKQLAQHISRAKKPDARDQRIIEALEQAESGRRTKNT
ncbi:YdeI/OmpD-associated family protein [Hymenobacter actinosclerus]|uniref:Bacteriocin-protection, YdeI or OmpD-Associated n=1 Tax=Hymenobacter actinosclerus TaxID=82805 RepID=A0A1I0GLP9_9BACT|nr:YdeI/OmpD-associated family protein [Hymenobacter actinosclerus]SET71004.1 Bacteriocin-protection, YdeI or OmpD-Associated [Hymenobacter actinosclerus]